MDPDVPNFNALVVSRPTTPLRHLPRIAVMILVAVGYFLVAAGLSLLQLLLLETMPPPRAATGPVIIFHPPPPGGGSSVAQGGGPAPSKTTTPPIHPPAPLPVVVPLPPPAETRDDPGAPASVLDHATAGVPGTGPGGGTGLEGPGPGGPGPGGPGGPCPTCPPGAGPGGPGTEIYPDGTAGLTPPVVITTTRALPKYPDLARRAAVQGTVVLLVVIDARGRVGEIQVLRSPDPRYGFDLAAIEAVKQWRYRPALLAGRPVAVQASVLIEFTLSR